MPISNSYYGSPIQNGSSRGPGPARIASNYGSIAPYHPPPNPGMPPPNMAPPPSRMGNGEGGASSQDPSFGGAANRGMAGSMTGGPAFKAGWVPGMQKGMQGNMSPNAAVAGYAAGQHNAAQMNGGVSAGKAVDAQGGVPGGPPQMSAQDVQAEMARRKVGAQVGANPQNAALAGYLMG